MIGPWAMATIGVGPVICAGVIARIDIHRAPTVGHIWRFAGLDPTQKWEKGKKRPWNTDLKRICWLLGESFVKVINNDDAFSQEHFWAVINSIPRVSKALSKAVGPIGKYLARSFRK